MNSVPERSAYVVTNVQTAAKEVLNCGGWNGAHSKAMALSANMNVVEWESFLQELSRVGLQNLAQDLRNNWTKVGTVTVLTVAEAVRRSVSTHNLSIMIPTALSVTQQYDEVMWEQFLRALEKTDLTKTMAICLRRDYVKDGTRTTMSPLRAAQETMSAGGGTRFHAAMQRIVEMPLQMQGEFLVELRKQGASSEVIAAASRRASEHKAG